MSIVLRLRKDAGSDERGASELPGEFPPGFSDEPCFWLSITVLEQGKITSWEKLFWFLQTVGHLLLWPDCFTSRMASRNVAVLPLSPPHSLCP
jgi:hypothetical protein